MGDQLTEIELKQISQLVYLDILDSQGVDTKLSNQYKNNGDTIELSAVIKYYSSPEGQQKLKERYASDLNGTEEYKQWNELLEEMSKPKYKDWEISNIVSNNKQNESGFVAMTVDTGNGAKVAAFRGSEPMDNPMYRNDWKNNGSTAYEMESIQQAEAREYMKSFQADGSYDLYLTGHSLGGNLALFSSFILPEDLRKQLISASTFNAPGFNGGVLGKYAAVIDEMNENGQLKEFRNKYDIVPALFGNPSDGIYIDTKSEKNDMLAHHSLFSLETGGSTESFQRSESQMRAVVPNLVHHITVGLEVVPNFLKEALVTGVFKVLDGDVDLRPLIMAGAIAAGILLVTVGPVAVVTAAVTAAMATLVAAIKAAIALYVIGFVIDKVLPWIKEGVQNIMEGLESFYNESVEFITNMVTEAVRVTNLIGDRVAEFAQQVKKAVSNFLKEMKEGLKRFVDNTIQYVKAQVDYWVSVKDKAAKKLGDIFQSMKAKFKKEKDEFVASARAFKDSMVSKVKAKITKTVGKIAVAAAGVVRGAKILANMDKLEALQRSLQRKEERVDEIVNKILALASSVASNVGSAYSESYVQSSLRQVQSLSQEVRSQKNRVTETIRSRTAGLKYTVGKYREVEAKLVQAARVATTRVY